MPNLIFEPHTMLDLLKRLVETESPSNDKAAVDRVGLIVAEECRKLGALVKILPNKNAGNHVVAKWGNGGAKSLLILCHMDTVFPMGILSKMPYREKDGKIFGPGTLDMKGGIAIALGAVAAICKSSKMPEKPIVALFTSDEEIGSQTSRELIEDLARQAEMVFVLESGLVDGSLKAWRKGVGDFKVKVKGRAAHAGGDHEQGRNAIEEMAHQVLAIQAMTDYERGTTLNVGVIQGGFAPNVVPDECEVEVDMRVLQPEEVERIQAAMQALRPVLDGTSIEVSGSLNRPPLPFNEVNQAAFEKAAAIARDVLGLELRASGAGGSSDGNFVAPLGVPVLDGLGAVGEGYHSEREYIFKDSLLERARLLAAFLRNW
jgi:glutamate carboxypeptidase